MSPRFRKLLGGFVMIAFVLVYALVAMALADSRPMHEAPAHRADLLYVVLGLAWVLPLMPLIRWMERGPTRASRRSHATLTRRPRFHSANGAPDSSTSR